MVQLRHLAALVTFLASPVISAQVMQSPSATPAVNHDSVIISDYQKKLGEYLKLSKKQQAGLPPLKSTDSPHQIHQRQELLAARVKAARQGARQGDIFTPDVSQVIKHLITQAYQAANPARVTATLRHAEPAVQVRLQVNAVYPQNVPLQTTPASILMNLPPLPAELEYRIVGQNLVLRDREADIIVDYLPAAIPLTS